MSVVDRPRVIGSDVDVPLVTGGHHRYVNLDFAASAPALTTVTEAVEALLPWYSSVHRGAGFKSQICTKAYEGARDLVGAFLHLRPDDAIIFTRNTTDSINLLARCLPDDSRVIASAVEHHANMLPWRRHRVSYLPVPSGPDELLEALERELRSTDPDAALVAVTGASNVTGEIWPLAEIAALAHRHGARVFVDAAQLAPHAPIDVTALDVDYIALSGHKLYAPFGAGVLAGRPDWLTSDTPFLMGGGAVEMVTLDDVLWSALPDRQEAGTPNVVGVVALGVACQTLAAYGMGRLAAEERDAYDYAYRQLEAIPGLEIYTVWPRDHPHIGVLTFNLDGYPYGRLAAILSAEYGIGVRHGCFCAHPLMLSLLNCTLGRAREIRSEMSHGQRANVPGAVRISLGLETTMEDIDYVAAALRAIVQHGPRWTYRALPNSAEYVPDPDPRIPPRFSFHLAGERIGGGESS